MAGDAGGDAAAALAQLRNELRQRRDSAGQTIDGLIGRAAAHRVRLGRTTVSHAFNDGHPPPTWRTVHALARATGADGAGVARLRELWERAARREDATLPVRRDDRSPAAVLSAGDADPALLEVHEAVLPGADPGGLPYLTPYLSRRHDGELRRRIEPAVAGECSVLVMVTGGSSTGKTRSLYEGLRALAPDRPLLRPEGHAGLLELLRAGRIGAGAVLWLDEAQRFFHGGPGAEAAADLLRQLLLAQRGIVAVGTMWTEPYQEFLARPDMLTDPHNRVRALLASPATRRVTVPDRLTGPELECWRLLADSSGDQRMTASLNAGSRDGLVVPHLSGGPELREAFGAGPGACFSHVEHALISAALAARGLHHYAPLPGALLSAVADAALDARHRPADPDWAAVALRSLCSGVRPDGRRTDIRSVLTALVAVRTAAGGDAAYEPADYLEQALRSEEALPAPSPALWRALEEHTTDPHELFVTAREAERRDFRKQATLLLRRLIAAGHPHVLEILFLTLPRQAWRGDELMLWIAENAGLVSRESTRAFLWSVASAKWQAPVDRIVGRAVARVDLTDPEQVAGLLSDLTQIDQEAALLDRDPMARVRLPEPRLAAWLLGCLMRRGHLDAAVRLADRLLPGADLGDAGLAAALLALLHAVGDRGADLAAVAREAAGRVDVGDQDGALEVLEELVDAGEPEAARLLAGRLAAGADVSDPEAVGVVLDQLRYYDGMTDAARLLAERAVGNVELRYPENVAFMLDGLRATGVAGALTEPFVQEAARHVDVTRAVGVTHLLWTLGEMGETEAAARIADRAVAQGVALGDPEYAAYFLAEVAKLGRTGAVPALAERAVAEADAGDTRVSFLLGELRDMGRPDLMERLARRSAERGGGLTLARRLRDAGQDGWAERVIDGLLTRSRVRLGDAYQLAMFLDELTEAEEYAAAARLARDAVPQVSLVSVEGADALLEALRKADLAEEAERLEARVAQRPAPRVWSPKAPYGLETDGSPAEPWTWDELPPVDEVWCREARAVARETRWM
ncbi:helix-turn-helix domain-containing protein [Streptomyces sp. NPDC021622]|uniref:helix-turn-helix domain-containing protein n=1 Tax=Streptomyces sp. NPDC021622 TaxID=3155013 RepID=UPI00340FB7FC